MDKSLSNILFIDIETVGVTQHHHELDERLKNQWARKAAFLKREDGITDEELFQQRAGIYSEFGKIVTIGLGYFIAEKKNFVLRTKALYDHNEKTLLLRFADLLKKINVENLRLCAHNGREFDFPYLSRRMLINGLPLPEVLDLAGKKPWEVNHLDTMDLWKFGDYKHYTSLELLATVFDIDSSKTGMDGSKVNAAYYEDDQLVEIADYCVEDVIVTAQVYLKLKSIVAEKVEVIRADPN
ncbi:3'-5' exonuclease [Fulvivirga sp. M361]|uniref:3'-5' exonuclease n=1 Tax=Fulvivirga sp. M361 TaxID=2594266 RepID=UPI001179A216|nr:3'-5' exonuclease [Fulvivirga sp. M361]TRX58688.1 3'-5' exonuclease [Fulvivirga sp. M361]